MGFLVVILIGALCFAGAFVEYVCGRILLPEVGLTAPGYWTWFWVTFWVIVFSIPTSIIKEMAK